MTVRNTTFILAVAIAFAVRGADLVYDVAEGETNTVTVAINADTANVDYIIKRGEGVLQFTNNVGVSRNFAGILVEKGRVELSMNADCFRPTNVVIKTGAEVWNTGGKSVFYGTQSFDMEEGSFLYLGGVGDSVDGFRGYGVISNKTADITCTVNLSKGPYRFGGRIVGNSIFECAASSGSAFAYTHWPSPT